MIAVIVAVVVSQIIGTIWYSSFFLGKPWMNNNFPGKIPDQISKEGNFSLALILCGVGQLCLAVFLDYILSYLGITSIHTAVKIGVGLGALVSISDISHCLFSCRSHVVFVIDHLYDVAVLTAMCVSLTYFR